MITIPNPLSQEEAIDIFLSLQRDTKNNVELLNNSPYINIKVSLEGYLTSSNESNDYSSDKNLKILSQATEEYLQNQISSYLYKTSKEFKADIVGYGKYAVKYYSTWDEWVNSDWLNNYQNSFFNVEVAVSLKPGELFSKV